MEYSQPSPLLTYESYKWLVLSTMLLVPFGIYWSYDVPGAIDAQLGGHFGNYTEGMNLSLYAIYGYTNIVMGLVGGILCDLLSVQVAIILFPALVLVGEFVFALGIVAKTFSVCLFGRFIFSLGGESIAVTVPAFIAVWFEGGTLTFAMGCFLSLVRIASCCTFFLTPLLAQKYGVPLAIWVTVLVCVFSFIAAIILDILDYYGRHHDLCAVPAPPPRSGTFFQNIMQICYDVKEMPLIVWVLIFADGMFVITTWTFFAVASDELQHIGDHMPAETASLYLIIPNLLAAVLSPILGQLIDKFGQNLWAMLVASILSLVSHTLFFFNAFYDRFVPPYVVMIGIGISYSIFGAALYGLPPFMVNSRLVGTVFGLLASFENLTTGITPQLIGAIEDAQGIYGTPSQYYLPCFVFIAGALGAIIGCIGLLIQNSKTGGILNEKGNVKEEAKLALNDQHIELVPEERKLAGDSNKNKPKNYGTMD
jgi:MFS family permease